MDEEDLYAILGLQSSGPQVPLHDVRKAYRARALVWHPDKQAGKNPTEVAAAAVEFEKIQRAIEILGDEKARKAYDDLRELRKSREEKERQFSAKRQKMMKDLRDRERAFESERAHKREEDSAAKRLKAEIARIRAEHAKKRAGVDASVREENHVKSKKTPTAAQAEEMQNTLKSTLKVSWICTDGGGSGYTAVRLKEIFGEFGGVDDIVIRESKSRGKGSALVVMKSKEAAFAAAESPCGDLSNPLLVVPAVPSSTVRREPVVNPQTTSLQSDRLDHVVGSSYLSYENDILKKMRQKAERERIIKEMQEADSKNP